MYLSLGVELIFFPVPSVASSYNLWSEKEDYSKEMADANINTFEWSMLKKIFFLALPIIIICGTFALPLLYASGMVDVGESYNWIDGSSTSIIILALPFIVMILGRLLSFYSVLNIRNNNKQEKDSFDLKNTSIYSKSRNPIQLGMYLFAFGLILLYPAPVFIIGIIFYILYMDYKIKIEEKFLIEKFGEPYKKYTSKTKRYI